MEERSEPALLRWETLTKKKFDQLDKKRCVVLVTCSPLEVHGPHLPFGTDALEGQGLAVRMLRFLPQPYQSYTYLQLPFLYTASDTLPHAGSLFFRPSTTISVLEDLGRSLSAQGFENIIVSNFHGSPRHFLAIEQACDTVSRERKVRMACIFSILLSRLTGGGSDLYTVLGKLPGVDPEDFVGDTHGGLVETSQLLALHPEWVERDYTELPRRTVDLWLAENGEAKPEVERGKPAGLLKMIASFRAGLRFFRAETYSGAPARASAELGEKILDTLAEKGAQALCEILDGTLPREQWHSPLWDKRFVFINPWMVRVFNRLLHIPDGVA